MAGAFVAGAIVSKLVLDMTQWNAATGKVATGLSVMGGGFAKAGRAMTMGLTVPIAAAGLAAVKVAGDFEQSIINAISVTGEKVDEVRPKMEALARTMGRETVFSASQAADAMYYMASAGWKVQQMEKALQPTLNLAAATQSDLAFTTKAVVSSLNQFNLTSADAGRVANVFAAAISNSQATMDYLAVSMRYAGPVADALGISIEETSAALMVMYNNGIEASQAGTSLRMGLAQLITPTGAVEAALADLGLTLEQVNPKTHSLADIMDTLKSRGAEAEHILDIFGKRAGTAFVKMVGQGGDALREFEAGITGTNRAAEMAAMQVDTIWGSFKLLKSALEDAAISIGMILVPAVRSIADTIKDLVQKFNSLSESTKTNIVKWALIVAAIGPAMSLFGKLLLTLPKIAGGFLKMGKAILFVAQNPMLLAAAAVVYYGIKLMELKKAQDAVQEAEERYAQTSAHLNNRLEEVRTAAGLSAEAWQKLTDKYDGNRTALVQAINRGKEGKELLDAMTKSGEKNVVAQKAMNDEAKAAIPVFQELNLDMKDYAAEAEGATKAAEEWASFVSGVGVKSIQDKAARVQELQGYLARLNREFKDGVWDIDSYRKMIDAANAEIKGLSETIVLTQVPVSTTAGVWADAIAGASDTMAGDIQGFTGAVAIETTKLKTGWATFTDGLQTNWSTMWGDMIRNPSWAGLKDAFKNFLGNIWSQFSDMLGQMVAKWTVDFVGKLASGTKDAAGSIVGGLKDVKDSALNLAKGFSPTGMIATGIGAAVGTFLGGLIGPKGPSARSTELIKDYTWEIAQHTKNEVGNSDAIKWASWNNEGRLEDIKKNGWSIYELLKTVPNWLQTIATNTKAMIKLLEKKQGGAEGAVITSPDLMFVHGTKSKPEYLLNSDQMNRLLGSSSGPGAGGQGVSINLQVANSFAFNNQVDENFSKRYVNGVVIPNILSSLDSNNFLTTLKERLGVA